MTIIYDLGSFVKFCFFGVVIRDIYRAIRGGALIGAFAQSMCTIDALAHLYNTVSGKRNTGKNFTRWVEDWLVPLNNRCKPDVTYAIRCGLVHTSGYSDALKKCGIDKIVYTHDKPDQHWTQPELDTYVLNLDSHVAELTVGAYNFLDRLNGLYDTDKELVERVNNLTYVTSIASAATRAKHSFAELDSAFSSLDQGQPQVGPIEEAIRKMYRKD